MDLIKRKNIKEVESGYRAICGFKAASNLTANAKCVTCEKCLIKLTELVLKYRP